MGYACPVCEIPQQDAEHLAHHLAFTAMLHGDDHESWLDTHASGWETAEPAELGQEVTEDVDEAEYNQVFEDTTDDHNHSELQSQSPARDGDHGTADRPFRGADPPTAGGGRTTDGASLDAETQAVLDEARELTRQMMSGSEAEQADETTADSDDSDTDDETD